MQKKQLILLKKQYNHALNRYNKMTNWVETATEEEQQKNCKHVIEVIRNLNNLYNEIKEIDPLITPAEAMNGFKEVR